MHLTLRIQARLLWHRKNILRHSKNSHSKIYVCKKLIKVKESNPQEPDETQNKPQK